MVHVLSFLLVLSVVVFIHEFGHYIVARWCGVRVEEFSLGFGPKLLCRKDRNNTEWKFCLFPLGGYVKMFGDIDVTSLPSSKLGHAATEEELRFAFPYKNVFQRFAIVIAGPLFNFLLALVVYCCIFMITGITRTDVVVRSFVKESTAQASGIHIADRLVAIDGKPISDAVEVRRLLAVLNKKSVLVDVIRENNSIKPRLSFMIKPLELKHVNKAGEVHSMTSIGLIVDNPKIVKLNLFTALSMACLEVYDVSKLTLQSLGQMIMRQRSFSELSGPIRIARYAAEASRAGFQNLLVFISIISIGLGLINLLPIPVLDGGYLAFCVLEMILRRPLPDALHKFAYRAGIATIGMTTIMVLFNDVKSLFSTDKNFSVRQSVNEDEATKHCLCTIL